MAIRILPPEVAARIAAGEVVERPASVVKELVENALDAGASRIAVEAVGGGIELIRVTDDGCGIEPQELELAFARHATSKLDDSLDLSRILTLGFRGEALPSIAAVAEVEMSSRPPGHQAAAVLRLIPEAPPQRSSRGAPVGTSVTVRHLFARQPARRKFLRSPSSEARAIASVVSHYVLAFPEVRFSLTIDGHQTLRTSGSGDLRDAAAAVYGAEVAAAMLTVSAREGRLAIEGLASPPHISRAGRGYISLFVNRRWVQNRRLAFAVEEAYQGLLMSGRHPIVVLGLRVPYEEVDVNVHPTKAEVRFRDEPAIFVALQRAVRQALLRGSPAPAVSVGLTEPAATRRSMPPLWEHARTLERHSTAQARGPAAASPPAPAVPALSQALPVLRVIGQFGSTYIVAEGPDGMYLIDQHAAHERVLYEHLCRLRQARTPEAQRLLEPVALDLPPQHRALLLREVEALREHGFDFEPFGGGSLLVRAVPASLKAQDIRQAMADILDLMMEEASDQQDRVAASLACHGAVRAGQALSLEEMRELIRRLEGCQVPNTCPHGRPTMIHMSAELLAREFGRR